MHMNLSSFSHLMSNRIILKGRRSLLEYFPLLWNFYVILSCWLVSNYFPSIAVCNWWCPKTCLFSLLQGETLGKSIRTQAEFFGESLEVECVVDSCFLNGTSVHWDNVTEWIAFFLLCRELVGSVERDTWVCCLCSVRFNESGCIQRDVDKSTYFEDLKIKMDFVRQIICISTFWGN